MDYIIIREITNNGNRLDIYFDITPGLEKYFSKKHHFFAEFSCDISDVPKSILVLPILGNLLQLSWIVNCAVWVDEIDSVFYHQIPFIKNAFREMYPKYKFGGTLIPARIIDNFYESECKAVLLFTGGVDATTTFFRIQKEMPILLNTNGWYIEDLCNDSVFDADKCYIDEFASKFNVIAHYVRSNFATFIRSSVIDREFGKTLKNSWWHGFQHSIAFLTCAAVVGYHYKTEKLFIGSSLTFGQTITNVSDPRIDNEIKCCSMHTVHDAYELSRTDKIKFLIQKQSEYNILIPLRVCSFRATNCCACEKCFRTMLAIVAEGGSISKFGFHLNDSILNSLKFFLDNNVNEVYPSKMPHWSAIISRMRENCDVLQCPEVLEFLEQYNFKREKNLFLYRYYSHNFFNIIVRKAKAFFLGI